MGEKKIIKLGAKNNTKLEKVSVTKKNNCYKRSEKFFVNTKIESGSGDRKNAAPIPNPGIHNV